MGVIQTSTIAVAVKIMDAADAFNVYTAGWWMRRFPYYLASAYVRPALNQCAVVVVVVELL